MGAWASAVIDFGAVGVYAATSHDLESDGFLDDWLGGVGKGAILSGFAPSHEEKKWRPKKGLFSSMKHF